MVWAYILWRISILRFRKDNNSDHDGVVKTLHLLRQAPRRSALGVQIECHYDVLRKDNNSDH